MSLKNLCDRFDDSFVLEGGKKKKHDIKLMTDLETVYNEGKIDEIPIKPSVIDWIVYMYGMTAKNHDHIEKNEEILDYFAKIKDEFITLNLAISQNHHFTSMIQVVDYALPFE